ncbi:MAG: methyltransferase family protein [Promethearchaeota archaeon]
MGKKNKTSKTLHTVSAIGKIFSFVPILASILAPMMVSFGFFVYFSYFLFLYPFFDIVNYYIWIEGFPIGLLIFEGVVLLIGLSIFLDSLISMTIQQKHNQNPLIVQKRLYKYIRHPQNLGILVMFLVTALYVPILGPKNYLGIQSVRDFGIRSGDILSWLLFFLFTFMKSLYEEFYMLNQFGIKYWEYIKKTGFFLPRVKYSKSLNLEYSKKNRKRYFYRTTLFFALTITSFGILFFIGFICAMEHVGGGRVTFPTPSLLPLGTLPYWVPIITLCVSVIFALFQIRKEKRKSLENDTKSNR